MMTKKVGKMTSHKKASLWARAVLALIFWATLLSILLFIATMTSVKINERIQLEHKASMQSIDGFLTHFNEMNIEIAKALVVENGDFVDALKNDTRQKELVRKHYKIYKSFVPSLKEVTILQKDADMKGREFQKEVFEEKQIRSGFEVEDGECRYEIIVPVFVRGAFWGAVEFVYDAAMIMQNLHKYYHHNIALVFYRGKQLRFVYVEAEKFKEIIRKNIETTSFKVVPLGDKEYSLYSRVENPKGKITLLSLYDATPNLQDRRDILYKLAVMMLAVLALSGIIINFIVNYFMDVIYKREDEIKTKVKELSFQTRHNTLTSLPNLRILQEEMQKLHSYTILMLKIDNVDILKTTYGMEVVKSAIKSVSESLQANLPGNAYLYHTEFDEFAIILEEPTPHQAQMLASQIKAYFSITPVIAEEIHMHLTFSIGISTDKKDTRNNIDLFSQANIALLEATHQGKSLVTVYESEMSKIGSYAQLSKNIAILQKDLEEEMLTPFYQAIVDVQSKEIIKYEALARIKDGEKFMSPYQFMEAAKVSGLHSTVTKQMIQKTFSYFDSTSVQFSINITRQDLLEGYLGSFLQAKTKRHNIDPSHVTLEILEDVIIDHDEEIIEQINKLSAMGFVIAIDDFGVESSNMSKLTQLHASFIKIDGSFIKDVDTNKKHYHIVESLVFIGRKLNMKIIAEFVHNEAVFNVIKDLGIDYAQGYYFAEPVEEVEF